jgi:hypothetical protein
MRGQRFVTELPTDLKPPARKRAKGGDRGEKKVAADIHDDHHEQHRDEVREFKVSLRYTCHSTSTRENDGRE